MRKITLKACVIFVLTCSLMLVLTAAAVNNELIAFTSKSDGAYQVWVMNPDGSGRTQLTNDPAGILWPEISPDGKKIAFFRYSTFDIYIMNSDGTNVMDLTNSPAFYKGFAWSPDSKQIVYSKGDSDFGPNRLYVTNADGSGTPRQLSNIPYGAYFPTWSPDGTEIAFASRGPSGSGPGGIYVANADGTGTPTQLTNSLDSYPAWSPSSRIAFQSFRNGKSEIFVMNPDGSSQQDLTSNLADCWVPTWSPDGTKIAFTVQNSAGTEIYVMNGDGTNQIDLTKNLAGTDSHPSWGATPILTSTSLSTSANPSVYGQPVTFMATVTLTSGTGTPTGSVQFMVDGGNLGAPVSLSGGSATSNGISTLSIGPHTVTAVYTGDTFFMGSTGSLTQVVQTTAQATSSLEATVHSLSSTVFQNGNMQNALMNKLNAVLADINAGDYAAALDQLRNDILKKTDGCAVSGMPDKNDWIKDCSTQEIIYPQIVALINALKTL